MRAALLGSDGQQRRHIVFVLATAQLYAFNALMVIQSAWMGLADVQTAVWVGALSLLVLLGFYAVVRLGWTTGLADPSLTLPHALTCMGVCVLTYVLLGVDRGNVMILMAQAVVASMFRLRPRQVLILGCSGVLMLAGAVLFLRETEPLSFDTPIGWLHLLVGGTTILMLSLIAKWVSDIRERLSRQAKELKEALGTVSQLATTDMLTGLLNRRVMTELLDRELKLASRQHSKLCIAMLDLDQFKQINDRHGHKTGDLVLSGFAKHASTQLRQVDRVARWGGEEFLVMLPRVEGAEAFVAMERLRTSAKDLGFPLHADLRISLSLGVAQAQDGDTVDTLIERADQALYEAKHQGRDRSVLAGAPLLPKFTADSASLAMDLRVGTSFQATRS